MITTNHVLTFIEINEPSKAPDIKYVSISSSDNNKSDSEFIESAIRYLDNGKFSPNTTFRGLDVFKFPTTEDYQKILDMQIREYFNSLKNK